MTPSTSLSTAHAPVNSGQYPPAQTLASLGVTREQFGRHQEQMRLAFLSPQDSSQGSTSLPFPLNLPPSYPTPLTSTSTAPPRHQRPPHLRQGASVTPTRVPKTPEAIKEELTRTISISNAFRSKGKGKRSLDAFMHSRRSTGIQDLESSGSDSDMSLQKMLALPQVEDSQSISASALPSSSPPSSSPINTPRESSPLPMYAYPSESSPTPRPKRHSSTRGDASNPSYTLPPGPYSPEKPSWSLAALIGQAINASHTGALALNDIYTYISTVYPHYNRRDQPWMSSIRHSLSVNDAFERVPDQEGNTTKRGRGKGMTRLKGGLWRIKPGHQACFVGGNFVRKGAKGAGPGKNLGGRKRTREEDEQRSDKKTKAEEPSSSRTTSLSRPNSRLASSSSQHVTRSRRSRSPYMSSSDVLVGCTLSASSTPRVSPPPLTASRSTLPSDTSFDPFDLPPSSPTVDGPAAGTIVIRSPDSSAPPLALMVERRNSITKANNAALASSLEPGFELEMSRGLQASPNSPGLSMRMTKDMEVNRDLFTRVLASTTAQPSTSQAGPSDPPRPARPLIPFPLSSSLLASSSSPVRPTTPPSCPFDSVTLSSTRTPMSHRGLHMSPSRSLAHYKSSLEPEWKSAGRRTPPLRGQGHDEAALSTPSFPSSSLQASPFRTPARPSKPRCGRGYDPYDPNTSLADELETIRNAIEPQESPGGFFGKEGRKLLYESPSVPGRSDWRFRDEF